MRELTNGAGVPFAFYAHDAYGNPTTTLSRAVTGISAGLAAAIAERNILRYAGYAYDAHSGLYYCSQRYYDPATASFITKDPAKADGEESAYQYCGGDPVGMVDPDGCRIIKLWKIRISKSLSPTQLLYSQIGGLSKGFLKWIPKSLPTWLRNKLAKSAEKTLKWAGKTAADKADDYTATELSKGYAAYIEHGLYTIPAAAPGYELYVYFATWYRTPLEAGKTFKRFFWWRAEIVSVRRK